MWKIFKTATCIFGECRSNSLAWQPYQNRSRSIWIINGLIREVMVWSHMINEQDENLRSLLNLGEVSLSYITRYPS